MVVDPGPVRRLVGYVKNDDGSIMLNLSCGHVAHSKAERGEDASQLLLLMMAFDRGDILYTHCDQCRVVPGPVVRTH